MASWRSHPMIISSKTSKDRNLYELTSPGTSILRVSEGSTKTTSPGVSGGASRHVGRA